MPKVLKLLPTFFLVYVLALPLVAGAQTTIDEILEQIDESLTTVVTILYILATAVFIWGVVQYLTKTGDPAAQDKAKATMLWGIIALAVISAAWGLAKLLIEYFQAGGQGIPEAPGDIQ
jgi:hypothetical protein